MDKGSFQERITALNNATAIEIPSILKEIELTDGKSAYQVYDEISDVFAKEDLIDNVVNPVFCTIIDGILAIPCFKGINNSLGLSAQRLMTECRTFNYDERMSYIMPDSLVESRYYALQAEKWKQKHRSKFNRSVLEDKRLMNRYKQQRIKENGGRVNMEDEYRMTQDISASRAESDKRRKRDTKYSYVGETDHITPLKKIFTQLQSNAGLSDEDIRSIANMESNLAVTARLVNNPKRCLTNSEFIAKQDELKALGRPYVELSPEQRINMLKKEAEAQKAINDNVNARILDNLTGDISDSILQQEYENAIKLKEKELGRKLTAEESQRFKRSALKKTLGIYKEVGAMATEQGLLHALGNAILLIIKPLYFELKDGFTNGFVSGVYASSLKEAVSIRFIRMKDYLLEQFLSIQNMAEFGMAFIKSVISSVIESIVNMFVGLLKHLLQVVKEGIKIIMQTTAVFHSNNSHNMTTNEKGNAIVNIIGGSIVALCGITIDSLGLDRVPEALRTPVKSLLTGLAGIIVFYTLDKADLFNVKEGRRHKRIKEVFDLRIRDIEEKCATLTTNFSNSLRSLYVNQTRLFAAIETSLANNNYVQFSSYLSELSLLLFRKPIERYVPGRKWNS